ncbi:GNAT superfamily N-acetyltransferase [Cryobacterium sp. MP_M5]|uniref:GNAT family N-acetyltransferase n=1 Tax=unclassified Cryobacterium TaxID=2649013 RepID=UPI0018C8EF85|nr:MULTISPECIES: GNAT family N-acetyltransferase [unclassified Cryobacterium]MBG6059779.1 GNAT superfamily N-acetyltransferase [Cryobacterium sp. MP_M3]MEC5178142.1 GNAT superfamily N-acetyltransferase [Cryobacterium sp. MP_M5]
MGIQIRMAEDQDFQTTEAIENRADELLIDFLQATNWPASTSAEERAQTPGFTLLAVEEDGGRTIGFAQVTEADESAHLEQIAVLPEFGRLGYGRQLVHAAADEVRRRGYPQVTLRTFAGVPWNAPFYATCGFAQSEPESHFQHELVATEKELGLPTHGPRIQMTRLL